MGKIVLVVEYDGTAYHGFQYQANAPTIQAELERAIYHLTGETLRVIAASRTDAGVHAQGQVVSFRTQSQFPAQTWMRALNYYLPSDIAVREAWPSSEDFNVRRDAVYREYVYSIWNSPTPSPFKLRFAYFFPQPLDMAAMQRASRTLEGEHDFIAFSPSSGDRQGRTVRTVYRSRVKGKGPLVQFHVAANSFLPHQVRHTIGSLLQVGRGRLGVGEFRQFTQTRVPGLAGPAAPPHGLCLLRVEYASPLQTRSCCPSPQGLGQQKPPHPLEGRGNPVAKLSFATA